MTTGLPREATKEMRQAGLKFAQRVSLSSEYSWTDYMGDLWRTMARAAPEEPGLQVGDRLKVLFQEHVYHCEVNSIPSNHAQPRTAALAVTGHASDRELGELNFWVDKDGRPCSSGFAIGDTVTILEVKR